MNVCCTPLTYWGFGKTPGAAAANLAISSSETNVEKSICGKLFRRNFFTSSNVFNFQMSCSGTQIMLADLGESPLTDNNPRLTRVFVVFPILLRIIIVIKIFKYSFLFQFLLFSFLSSISIWTKFKKNLNNKKLKIYNRTNKSKQNSTHEQWVAL